MNWFGVEGVIGRVWSSVCWKWWCPRIFGDHADERVGESVLVVGVVIGLVGGVENDRDWFGWLRARCLWPSILGDHAAERFDVDAGVSVGVVSSRSRSLGSCVGTAQISLLEVAVLVSVFVGVAGVWGVFGPWLSW